MTSIFGSPSSYVQGKNILFESKGYVENLGKSVLLLSDKVVNQIVGNDYEKYLTDNGFEVVSEEFNGESSINEINRVADIAKQHGSQVVIGLGGGKTVDTAKAIGDKLKIKVAIMPTMASTDAPTSRLSVIYQDDGTFSNYLFYGKNPDLVLVDTRVVANAPVRTLISGIGDALATNVEAQAVAQGGGTNMLGANQTLAGNAIAQMCEDTLFKYGNEAVLSSAENLDTKALDRIVEANTLMSGLGFESGGLAAAHAIYNGMTVLKNDSESMTHGEKVAFGLLTQLYLAGADKETFERYLAFEVSIGLPTTFEDLKMPNVTDEELLAVAKAANSENDTMSEMPFKVEPDDIVQAMKGVDAYSRVYKKLNHII
ncbi:glycerol dehydrogenase [Lactobacillaceae bacterium Melli_B3]